MFIGPEMPPRSYLFTRIQNCSKKLADDTSFPFKPGEELWARIEGKRLVVEKVGARAKK